MRTILIVLIAGIAVVASARVQATESLPSRMVALTIQTDKPVDVSGVWAFQIEIPGGGTGTPTVTFKQAGEKLSGTYSSQVLGEWQFTGTVKGNVINFSFDAQMEGTTFKVAYSGTVEKDTMKGKVTFGDAGEGAFTATKK